MKYRLILLAAASAATLMTDAAYAQDAAADEATTVEQVVVTGVRAPRSRLDTVSPVDVVTSREMQQQATTELGQALANAAPSIDFPRPTITDGTDSVRPATLRGLAPDQTLVLVNGVRQHSSALVNLNGSIGRGSSAVDLNTIPLASIGTVEVLREGASAQYGSDAIAGVINIRLREARDGGNVSANLGQYYTRVETLRTSYKKGDGAVAEVSGWKGLPLGADGFLTISAEYRNRQPTHRSDIDPRDTPLEIRGRAGDPEIQEGTGFVNAGLPLNGVWSAYGWVGYQYRDSESAATARTPSNPNNDLSVYPDGFLPFINPIITDWTGVGGVRGDIGGWKVDANASFGQNRIHYYVKHSINGSLVPDSPTDFNAGSLQYKQWLANLDVDKSFADWGLLAFGYEYRHENYQIHQGEPASWEFVPGRPGAGAGSQGFIGFVPANQTDRSRHSQSVYGDFDVHPVKAWDIDFAARYEDYSDFGTKTTGKIATRYDFTDSFAIRGAYSTGFRAPGLQQQAFTSTAINFLSIGPGGSSVPVEVVTLPPDDPRAQALGAAPLRPETSDNYSLGFVFHQGPFELTVDGYDIKIKDRIVLSENLTGSPTGNATAQAIFNLLNPNGGTLGGARFFINGVDSTTKGVDVVARYRFAPEGLGRFGVTLAGNYNHTDITRVPTIPTNIPIPNPPSLFNRINVLTFEEGTPKYKFSGTLDWTGGPWGGTAKLTYYGNVTQPFSNTDVTQDVDIGSHVIADVEGRYRFGDKATWAIGVNNLFDEYPDPTPLVASSGAGINTSGAVPFSNYSPFGFNGRFLYTRLSVDF
jgi:iron complex outermembrane receptor protein